MKIANDALIRDYDIYDKPYIILFDEAIEDAKLIGPIPEEPSDDLPISDTDPNVNAEDLPF